MNSLPEIKRSGQTGQLCSETETQLLIVDVKMFLQRTPLAEV